MKPRYFALEEANSTIEVIRPLMEEIQTIRRQVLARSPELWPAMAKAAGNGGSAELSKLARDFERLHRLVHSINETGAEIKDLGEGLVDFRFRHGTRDVYLCWKYGEDQIGYWHEIGDGFAGRQGIESLR